MQNRNYSSDLGRFHHIFMPKIQLSLPPSNTVGTFKLSSNQLISKLDMSFQWVYHNYGNVMSCYKGLQDRHTF